ncbi:hypothetical protein Gotur_009102 [Gossypium turneri]
MYVEKRSRNIADKSEMRKAPSLVDLCVRTVIDNVRYLGDVGETDSHLLERILPHCTVDQLLHVETSTKGRDLSSVTDKLWKNFYELQFGRESMKIVIERMKLKKASFRWRQLYEAKLKDVQEAENKAIDRLKQLYKKEDARMFLNEFVASKILLCVYLCVPTSNTLCSLVVRILTLISIGLGKQSRQVQLCTKVPPSSKRSFFAGNILCSSNALICWFYLSKCYLGSGPGYNMSNVKSNIMKKAKIDLMKSQEVKNLAAMKKKAVQSHHSGTTITKSSGFCGKNSASTSKHSKPLERRF